MQLLRSTLFAATLGAAIPALAAGADTPVVSHCWIRAMPASLPSGGYFKLDNPGERALALTGIESDAFGMSMMHKTESQGSTSTMAMVDEVDVPAHGAVTFAPGGYHVMLEKPKHALTVGSTVPLVFAFSDGRKVTAACSVKPAASMGQ